MEEQKVLVLLDTILPLVWGWVGPLKVPHLCKMKGRAEAWDKDSLHVRGKVGLVKLHHFLESCISHHHNYCGLVVEVFLASEALDY